MSSNVAEKLSSVFGVIRDRASIIGATGSNLKKAAVKATTHDEVPPKEKHVRTLVVLSNGEDPDVTLENLVEALADRLQTSDWVVALKALVVVHRVLRDGSARFIQFLSRQATVFNMSQFTDNSTPLAWEYTDFVRSYADYLEEYVCAYRDVRKVPGNRPIDEMSAADVVASLRPLIEQYNVMFKCELRRHLFKSKAYRAAVFLILKDAFQLYRRIVKGITRLLDIYFEIEDRGVAAKALDLYEAFQGSVKSLRRMIAECKEEDMVGDDMPDLKEFPSDLVREMQRHISDLASGHATQHVEPLSKLIGGGASSSGGAGQASAQSSRAPAPPSTSGRSAAAAPASASRGPAPAAKPAAKQEFDFMSFEEPAAKPQDTASLSAAVSMAYTAPSAVAAQQTQPSMFGAPAAQPGMFGAQPQMGGMGMQPQMGMGYGAQPQMGMGMGMGMQPQMGMGYGAQPQMGMGMGMQPQMGMGMGMQPQMGRGMGMQPQMGMGMGQPQMGMGMGMGMGMQPQAQAQVSWSQPAGGAGGMSWSQTTSPQPAAGRGAAPAGRGTPAKDDAFGSLVNDFRAK